MPTHEDLLNFTHGQLVVFSYEQLNRLTADELRIIAETKVVAISKKDPAMGEHFKAILKFLLSSIAANAAYEGFKSFILLAQDFLASR